MCEYCKLSPDNHAQIDENPHRPFHIQRFHPFLPNNNLMIQRFFFRNVLLVVALLMVTALLLACGNQAPAATSESAATSPTAAPTIKIASPTPAPTRPSAPAKEKAENAEKESGGKEYPMAYDFTGKNLLTGETFSSSDYRGKIVFLNFWGSWCPPCRMEMPSFQKVYEDYDGEVMIIGVGINDSAENLVEFAKSIGVTYPIVHDRTSEIARHYRIRSLPTTYRIDQEGRVRGVAVGALTEEQLNNAIQELLQKK